MSQIEDLKEQRAKNKQEIFQILDFNDLEYGNMQFDNAYEYLKIQVIYDDWISELTASKMFWKWWINQWDIRDRNFLSYYRKNNSWNRQVLIICYKDWHAVENLGVKISGAAYDLMIEQVKQEQVVND